MNIDHLRERHTTLTRDALALLEDRTEPLEGEDLARYETVETELRAVTDDIKRHDNIVRLGTDPRTSISACDSTFDRDPLSDPRDVQRTRANPWTGTPSSDADWCTRAVAAMEHASGLSDTSRQTAVRRLEANEDPMVARVVLTTTSPDYVSGFSRMLRGEGDLLTPAERDALRRGSDLNRAMSVGTGSAGGYLVPETLDPTLILDDAGAISPVRALARKAITAHSVHNFVTSTAVSASWDAEAAEVSDDTTTLAEVDVAVHKLSMFVPFSIEVELQSAANLWATLAELFADAKNNAEASAHVTGTGSGQPQGFVTGFTGTSAVVTSATADTFAIADVYAVLEGLAARYRPKAQWLANILIYNDVRQFGTSDSHALWTGLEGDVPPKLLGRPTHEASAMDGSITAAADNYVLCLADWHNAYGIVDRIGLTVEPVPHLFHTTSNRPSGQRGMYAYAMTGGKVLTATAAKLLNVT